MAADRGLEPIGTKLRSWEAQARDRRFHDALSALLTIQHPSVPEAIEYLFGPNLVAAQGEESRIARSIASIPCQASAHILTMWLFSGHCGVDKERTQEALVHMADFAVGELLAYNKEIFMRNEREVHTILTEILDREASALSRDTLTVLTKLPHLNSSETYETSPGWVHTGASGNVYETVDPEYGIKRVPLDASDIAAKARALLQSQTEMG